MKPSLFCFQRKLKVPRNWNCFESNLGKLSENFKRGWFRSFAKHWMQNKERKREKDKPVSNLNSDQSRTVSKLDPVPLDHVSQHGAIKPDCPEILFRILIRENCSFRCFVYGTITAAPLNLLPPPSVSVSDTGWLCVKGGSVYKRLSVT
jgi:hypothetical protein